MPLFPGGLPPSPCPGGLSQIVLSGAAVTLMTLLKTDFYKIDLFYWGGRGEEDEVKSQREKYRKKTGRSVLLWTQVFP